MFGYEITAPPESMDGVSVLARFVDGLAFRYHWATEGLRPEDFAFRPGPESMSLQELLKHTLHLAFMVEQTVMNASVRKRVGSEEPSELRSLTLSTLSDVRRRLESLSDEELHRHEVLRRSGKRYPVWHIMNGPLADALTHVGQINAWRRLSGNPTPPVDVFSGTAPTPSGSRDAKA